MKRYALLLTLAVVMALTPKPAAAQSVILNFPGYSNYFGTTSWFYCEGQTCYLISPFQTIMGPDTGYIFVPEFMIDMYSGGAYSIINWILELLGA